MTHLFRFSRPRAVLLSTLLLPILASCGGGGGGGGGSSSSPTVDSATPAPTSPTDTNGACTNSTFSPNYASSVSLLRWQRFPLRVFFINDAQFSESRKSLALAGFNQWVSKTGNRADYSVVSAESSADVVVSFFTFTGGSGDTLGTTTVSYDGNNTIRRAVIKIGITGQGSNDILTAAHEYGHTLGITGHSPNTLDLMFFQGNLTGEVTTRDLNTVLTAYCNNFNRNTNRESAAVGPLKTYVSH